MHNRIKLKSFLMVSLQELKELRTRKLIGKLKPGIAANAIISCTIGDIHTGFVVINKGRLIESRLLKPTPIKADELEIMGLNCARTLFRGAEVQVNLTPLYEDHELGG